MISHSPMRKRLNCVVLLAGLLASACGESVPADSACRQLVYENGGVPRAQYLPCAGEMIAALDELAPQADAAFNGDSEARSKGRATLRHLQALMSAAGGRDLLERWDDSALTSLNVSINNAVTHYEAFYMVRILDEPHQFAAQTREAARVELVNAVRRSEEAGALYRRLR